jgi:DNA-directed RNA polymerase specialized sigma subunit
MKCMRITTARDDASRLTREAEKAKIEEYQASRNVVLVAPIIKHHLALVNRVARRYVKLSGNDRVYKDLVGAGVLELIRALKEYRPSECSDFGTYADPYVRRAMLKELHRFNATRNPRDVWRRLANITFIHTCRNCIRQCVY